MARQSPSAIISGGGWMASVFLKLRNAVQEAGGTDEDLYKIDLPDGQPLITQMAQVIVASGKVTMTRVVEVTKTVVQAIGEAFRIVVPDDRTLEQRIQDTGCESIYNELSDADLPECILGVKEVMMVHPNQYFPNTKALETWLNERELCIAAPQDALQFAKDHPELQRQFWYAVFWWDKNGRLCYVILHQFDRKRCVGVSRIVDDDWTAHCRFLVVRKGEHSSS